jgi:PEP-CTERM motif
MRNTIFWTVGVMLCCITLAPQTQAQTNLAFWNFNDGPASGSSMDAAGRANLFSPDTGLYVASATMTPVGMTFSDGIPAGAATRGIATFTGTSTASTVISPAPTAGIALIIQGQGDGTNTGTPNNGSHLLFTVPTTGYENIKVSFAAQRTTTGFGTAASNLLEYSLDSGASWLTTGLAGAGLFTPSTSFSLQTFDLTSVVGINNLGNAQFRLTFDGATASLGNNRIDNLLVSGTAVIPEPTTLSFLMLGSIGFLRKRKKRVQLI